MHAVLLVLAAAAPLKAHVALSDARDPLAPEVQQLVSSRLSSANVPLLEPADAQAASSAVTACRAKPKCLAALATERGLVLVTIDLGKLSGMLVGHFEATDGKQAIASVDFAVPREKWRNDVVPFITTLVSAISVHVALATPAAPEPVRSTAPLVPVVTAKPQSSSPVLPLVLGGGAVAFGAAAGVLGYLTFANINTFNRSRYTVDGMSASSLDRKALDSLAASANLEATAAWVCGAAAVVLLAATVWAILTGTG